MKLFRILLGTTSNHVQIWQAAVSSCDGLGDQLPPVTVSGAQPDGTGEPRLLTLNQTRTQGAEPGESPALSVTLEKAANPRASLILLSYNPTVCGKWFTHQGSFVLQCCAACAGSQINSKVWPSSA